MESNRRRRWDEPKAAPTPSTVHDVPNHVLELILLGLDSSVYLVRAASACKRWHRVVADIGFQRRFRRPVLGHYVYGPGDPVFVPSPIPSIHSGESFSLDFVPMTDGHWRIADSRGGLLLLRKTRGATWCRRSNPDLAVCEPRTRRYRVISVLPDMLAGRPDLGLFLLDAGGRSIGLSSFNVMAVVLTVHRSVPGRGVLAACVYSGRGGTWHNLRHCVSDGSIDVPATITSFFFAGRANGSLYWGIGGGAANATALVLDEATVGFSQVALPEGVQGLHEVHCFRVVGEEDDTLRAVCLIDNDLRVYAWLRLHGDDHWVLENVLLLPEDTHGLQAPAMIIAAHETYVLVAPRHSRWLFSVDLKTMAVERVRNRNVYNEWTAYPYELPWPPVLKAWAQSPC
ncbi:unnamed protein product [Urochloa decumbens]|uniref:F-box domain-containing protein n=1 Tax=Urochloa decumbens TaxID=240449 RepID=A0ABC9G9S6_9POAL